ncbi:CPBP family intramembrane glutamic endopeptidase [Guptibacillus algicola]|uniref:CPBP family intramembrane glutamic endopeptidase n=1 Tax=Guptibacillus algicola TaxID=225844 RepID=UPI001CD56410|nr:CPBP family intramembrane glutamic endopeptidase [Alkalihalobacillus algicola]MCA0985938.1 CPBP family intramembrane metalloprotease [Alkalihalobacillus algicola]
MLTNKRLLTTILIAHLLLFLSFFVFSNVFWQVFTVSLLLLIILSYRSATWKKITFDQLLIGTLSGLLLYLLFYIGKQFMLILFPEMITSLQSLYDFISPKEKWHYVSLILVIIPGEELFWRGFVQGKLEKASTAFPILLATVLYTSVHIYAGTLLLLAAALLAGFTWGYLYKRTGTITVPILSHLVFDLMLLVFFPLL